MGKGPCSFRVNDAKRGVRACEEAGLNLTGVTINPRTGEIRIETSKKPAIEDRGNDWDEIKAPAA